MKAINITRIILLIVWLISCSACDPNAATCKRSKQTMKRFDSTKDQEFKAVYVHRQYIVAYVIEYEGKQYLLSTDGGIIEIK